VTTDLVADDAVVEAPVLGLPAWPVAPEPVDPSGTSYLVIALGSRVRVAEVAGAWVRDAEGRAPTRLVVLDDVDAQRAELVEAFEAARTGVRIMVVGGQYDVLTALALARAHGAGPDELRAFVVDASDLPVYCAHCRDAHRLVGARGGEVDCPGCGRRLEVHPHHSATRGAFLASDARARELT